MRIVAVREKPKTPFGALKGSFEIVGPTITDVEDRLDRQVRLINGQFAIRASEIGNLTGDPIDRIIVATAQVEDAVSLTADGSLLDWPGQVPRQDAQR